MKPVPLYKKIFNHYQGKILAGELAAGIRLPSEKEISKLFSVSRITVSRALNELENKKYIKKIKGSGSYVNEKTKWSDNDSSSGKTPLFVSLILPTKGNFSSEILMGVEDISKENGYFVTFHSSLESPEMEKEIIEELLARGSAGFIVYPIEPTSNLDIYSTLVIKNYPFVLIDKKIPGIDASLVWTDNYKSFYDLTCHLIQSGHSRIIFAGTSIFELSSEAERYRGFCQAHIDNGIPLLHKNIYSNGRDALDISPDYLPEEEYGKRVATYFFEILESMDQNERPTAIAAVNDSIAALLITTAIERGISIPGDYSITGFDNLQYAAYLPVPLTTIAQPARKIGQLAAQELITRISDSSKKPESMTVEAELIIRSSTGNPPIR